MKRTQTLFALAAFVVLCAGCSDDSITPAGVNTLGSVNPSSFVAIGNSITAGYQDGALYEAAQRYSMPALLASQLGTTMEQPLCPGDGVGNRIRLASFTPLALTSTPSASLPTNSTYPKPYNNLGVPGAVLFDALDTEDLARKYVTRKNPYFQIVMRDQVAFGSSIVAQALKLNPTLITFWLGNNDVLGFATSGGTSPAAPTNATAFDMLYGNALSALRQGAPNAAIVVANIPDVRSIPFFTTVGPVMSETLKGKSQQLGMALKLYFQAHGRTGPGLPSDSTDLMRENNVLIPLSGMAATAYIGDVTGAFWTAQGITPQQLAALNIDATKPFGLHPLNPWPDALVLDISEQTTAANAVAAFNASIRSAVDRLNSSTPKPPMPIALVDVNALLVKIASGGISVAGEKLTAGFISGGAFSFDGVHPSSKGNAVITNEFLRVINATYGANIAYVDMSRIPGIQVPMGKAGILKSGLRATPGTFDAVVRLFSN
ncbi:MAG: SGNH/GDSL hydrolase family protein [Ignavibacteriae bacterium]|nr:SGNH/GDSL hydrolase family protein [Ignavibacteriota bacterium]